MKQLKSAMLEIEQLMAPALDNAQMGRLRAVLEHCLFDIDGSALGGEDLDNDAYLDVFLKAKRLEGCSERTIG
ncbi:MAG: integrase, partial [Atopobiaceae bacterium]|nr:integrase [Atopobiaceae bacterium]